MSLIPDLYQRRLIVYKPIADESDEPPCPKYQKKTHCLANHYGSEGTLLIQIPDTKRRTIALQTECLMRKWISILSRYSNPDFDIRSLEFVLFCSY
ncbi:hypothetical protein AVEN_186527-1 [Araneus ventricosus]|uniref:Uncharacterized protein n=1 Tax=Araneus ventricosus TaxID=182803 RepID=A0A4Y2REY9_ARAVE|nr:hypothetical protein AVEN_186527-1 [Araneus ventricosus]